MFQTKDLKAVLNKKKRVFFQGTTDEKKQVNREVRGVIRKAKEKYRKKTESKFSGGCLRAAWQGIRTWQMSTRRLLLVGQGQGLVWRGWLMRHCQTTWTVFFTRFETHDCSSHVSEVRLSLMPADSAVIDQDRVMVLFKHTGVNKCPGPDGIYGRTQILCRAA